MDKETIKLIIGWLVILLFIGWIWMVSNPVDDKYLSECAREPYSCSDRMDGDPNW